MKQIYLILFFCCLSILSFGVAAESKTSERIKGVASFLVDRANDNYLYIFQKKIEENTSLRCYFPTTYENLKIGGYASLKNLLMTRGLWKESIKKDLEILVVRSLLSELNDLSKLHNNLKLEQYKTNCSILLNDLDMALEEKSEIKIAKAREALKIDFKTFKEKIYNTYKTYRNGSLFYKKITAIKTQIDKINSNKNAFVNKLFKETICKQFKLSDTVCTEEFTTFDALTKFINNEAKIINDEALLNRLKIVKLLIESNNNGNITSQVFGALKKINEQLESEPDEYKKFKKLSKYILFFASVADANSEDEVQEILKNYTLPSVSFFEKRQPGHHLMITSYLGVAGGKQKGNVAFKANNGLFAPVGLEYSFGFDSEHSFNIMVAPFDFGYPISLKFNGIEEDVDFDEIVAPSINFSWGIKNYPLVLGLGYQQGRRFELTNSKERRVILFFAFDMPLINLDGG